MSHKQGGFTIAELMIVVTVAAILAALAVPNMAEFIKNNNRATRVNTMVTALTYARAEAVTRNTRVSLCRSTDFLACSPPATNPGQFHSGWIVFTDGDTRGTVDGTDVVLRVFQPDMSGSATLYGRNTGGFMNGVSYRNSGLPEDISGGALLSTSTNFRYCDDRGATKARGIAVSTSGHVNLSRDSDGDGTDDFGGTNLVCP